jgi:dTDP-4-amino-4,6-dideoxygalactose transaminase
MKVPFLDLGAQYAVLRREIDDAIQEVIDHTAFAGGPYVQTFEEEFAAYCQCASAAGVSNGTDALHLALLALGVGPGDEVITAANTFIATAEAISQCGAVPVFADCDPQSYTLDPAAAEAAITPRTRAIIPVHLFGQPADMDAFLTLAKKHNLFIVEDACQAHGAEYKGRRAGSMGHAGCFSFYPGKNLGAYGDAGAVTSNDEELIRKIKVLRDHGSTRKYEHTVVGWNFRMDGIQGAVLSVKLRHLEAATEARRAHAHRYKELLRDCAPIILPFEAEHNRHVFHIFAICYERRDELMAELASMGVGCGIHYPKPLHLQKAYASLGKGPGDYPVAEQSAAHYISLPMFPELAAEQIEYVVEAVKAGVAGSTVQYEDRQMIAAE